jgi:hypothetical protein
MNQYEKEALIEGLQKLFQIGEALGFDDSQREIFLSVAVRLEEGLEIDELDFNK